MEGAEVARGAGLVRGDPTPGITRERAFDVGEVIFSRSTVAGGTVSQWHHHGERRLFGYVTAGKLRLEFEGGDSIEVGMGDFFQVAPGKVHRDVNPDAIVPAVIVNLLIGRGDPVVNVPGPAP